MTVLLAYRGEIVHPEPERALRVATLTASTAIEMMCFAPHSVRGALQPISEQSLIEELTRAMSRI